MTILFEQERQGRPRPEDKLYLLYGKYGSLFVA